MKPTTFAVLSLICAAPVFAQETRNSGNGVVTYQDEAKKIIQTIELFDVWESKRHFPLYGKKGEILGLDLSEPDDRDHSVETYVENFITRVEKRDSERGKRYRTDKNIFTTNPTEFVVGDLALLEPNTDHPRELPKPPEYFEQFAIQNAKPALGTRRYQISGRLYDAEAATNMIRAGILCHELALRDEITNNEAKNSDSIRPLIYFYLTRASEMMDDFQVVEFYQKIGVKHALQVIEFEDPALGRILARKDSFWSAGTHFYPRGKGQLKGRNFEIHYDNLAYPDSTEIEVTPNGKSYTLDRIWSESCSDKLPCTIRIRGKQAKNQNPELSIELFLNGTIREARDIVFKEPPHFSVKGTPCIGSEKGILYFDRLVLDEKANILGCDIGRKSSAYYSLPSGKQVPIAGHVEYFPSGKLFESGLRESTKIDVYGSNHSPLVLDQKPPVVKQYWGDSIYPSFWLTEDGLLSHGSIVVYDESDPVFKVARMFSVGLNDREKIYYISGSGGESSIQDQIIVSGTKLLIESAPEHGTSWRGAGEVRIDEATDSGLSKLCKDHFIYPRHSDYFDRRPELINLGRKAVVGNETVFDVKTGKAKTLIDQTEFLADGVFCSGGLSNFEFLKYEFP